MEVIFKILVVDDDKNTRKFLCALLHRHGFETLQAEDGLSALKAMDQYHVDLVVLDLMMPNLNGYDLTTQLRQGWENLPIMMVTAKQESMDKRKGFLVGTDDYMTKPFSPSELVARVKAHLARYERLIGSNVQTNDIIEIRGLKIDTTARRVWVNGEEKAFTTKEFDLLTFLAGHPNHVYTKDELFSEIWDMESIGDIATVTVHIKKIREKIEYDTSKPQYIETIWGVGYRFKV